ncbi:MAG: LptF/LptG family permease [Gemmatimonas sp.]|nr:LptF/LptG family permease [Gemmatimonas sp.]
MGGAAEVATDPASQPSGRGDRVKILDRYLSRQFLATFILLVTALPFLFLITDLTDQLDNYIARGLPARAIAISYIYYIPQLVFWGFPIAALIATVFTIGNMTRHQEIAAAKAGGVSFYRIVAPVLLLGGILSVAAIGVGELVPVANQKRSELLESDGGYVNPFRMNLVFRTEDGRTLAANRLSAESNEMQNVVLENRVAADSMWISSAAGLARWNPEEGWTLEEGYQRWVEDSGEESSLHFSSMQVPHLRETPEELLTTSKEAEAMRYRELERFIDTIERSGGDSSEFRVYLAQKLALPLAVLVIVLFGAPLATSSERGGTAFGVGISLAVTMVYLMLFQVGEAIGASGAIHPLVAAWSPNVLFLVSGAFLFWRVRT